MQAKTYARVNDATDGFIAHWLRHRSSLCLTAAMFTPGVKEGLGLLLLQAALSQMPSTPVNEIRAAFLATCLGLVVGCLTMFAIELVEVGSGSLWRLLVDYWFRFLPPYALGYAASIGIGTGVSIVIRNLGHRSHRRAEERRVEERVIPV
jgi:hypothetical protein